MNELIKTLVELFVDSSEFAKALFICEIFHNILNYIDVHIFDDFGDSLLIPISQSFSEPNFFLINVFFTVHLEVFSLMFKIFFPVTKCNQIVLF